jgi:hypothetical protein
MCSFAIEAMQHADRCREMHDLKRLQDNVYLPPYE